MTKDDKEQVFVFLDNLRKSGLTNMYGASPYIGEVFGFSRETSRSLLLEWMETFDTRHPRSE